MENRVEHDKDLIEGRAKPTLWFVVPCFNESEVLPETAPLFLDVLDALADAGKVGNNSNVLFVDDGSTDSTWSEIESLARSDERVRGLRLSRNYGHQNALLAGLMEVRGICDVAISADCDGQDDLSVAGEMVDAYLSGAEVVYGIRSKRDSDTSFKRLTARAFYALMRRLGAEVVADHADYRLLGSRALDALAEFGESNLFLRGLVPLVGFESATVYYERSKRVAGKSHYSLGRMIHLASDGVTSLSAKPMHMILWMGILFLFLGLALAIWAVVMALSGNTAAGWASIVCIVSIIGGIQLFALGVIGEYIGKIYLEVKRRPRYIVDERTW